MITGTVYLERGRPVTVLCQWSGLRTGNPGPVRWLVPPAGAPRNVLILRHHDGSTVVRPFRGLRRATLTPIDT